MTACRLLAVDIDGTLAVAGQEVPSLVVDSLRRCMASGISVIFSTGKRFVDIRSLCTRVGVEGAVITCNGAVVAEAPTGKILSSFFLPEATFRRVVLALEQDERVSIAVFTEDDIVCTARNVASRLLSSIGEPTTRFVDSLFALDSGRVAKVLAAVHDPMALQSVYDLYSHRYGDDCSVTITSGTFIEFMSRNTSKGSALLRVADRMGIPRISIACIGDSDNDLSMFEVAGLSIAVANATPSILEVADVIVPPACEYGVVKAVELILGEGYGTI